MSSLKILANSFTLSFAGADSQSIITDANASLTFISHVAMYDMPSFLPGQSVIIYLFLILLINGRKGHEGQ